MVSPPPWPQPHPRAEDFDLFWLVRQLPPDPFPDPDYDYAADNRFGPPGTRWVFSIESLVNRRTAPGASQGAKAAIERLIKKAAIKLPPAGSTSWATPLPLAGPAQAVELRVGEMQKWIRTAINGQVGTDEQVVHVLNWRHKTVEDFPIDNAGLKAFGDIVRDKWVAFLNKPLPPNSISYLRDMPGQLRYTDVRTSLLVQDAPAAKPTWPLQTQFSSFTTANVGQSTANPLPYEVALGISLNTNWRGTSRFRGRLYLGPLSVAVMGTDGQFGAYVNGVAAAFGTEVMAGVKAASDFECHIISQKYATSAAVTGVRVGHTPDSQRRRRRGRAESYNQVWGTAVGAA
jgi:hypothetical protein